MSEDAELKAMAKQLNDAIENGMDDDTPHLSVDPKTSKPAVVGDPNKLREKQGTYKLTFAYPPDELSEEDKLKMKLQEKSGYYLAEIKYENIRIKPLYRARIAVLAAGVLADANIIDLDGYTTAKNEKIMGDAFLTHTDDILEIMKMVLNIDKEQLEYLLPSQPGFFFVQLFQNEPKLLEEANNFLS